jgi:hypothetical protein
MLLLHVRSIVYVSYVSPRAQRMAIAFSQAELTRSMETLGISVYIQSICTTPLICTTSGVRMH